MCHFVREEIMCNFVKTFFSMKHSFLSCALAGLLLASCAEQAPAPRTVKYTQQPGTVKLISYNIRQSGLAANDGPNAWPKRKEATLNMIEREVPGVLGLQELLPDQQRYIRAAFPQYGFVGVGRDDGKDAGECMGVMYLQEVFDLLRSGTFWLSETPDQVSKGWDAACHRTVTWVELQEKSGGRKFFFLNTHLDHVGEVARAESIKLIVSKIAELVPEGEPVLLGGDLNSAVDSPIFAPLAEAGLEPARETAPETSHSGTFNAFGSAPSGIVLDHIFARGVSPLKFETLKGNYGAALISDHYPIAFTFGL